MFFFNVKYDFKNSLTFNIYLNFDQTSNIVK
jgi:hypothetical protein